jgi:hypothetical protein
MSTERGQTAGPDDVAPEHEEVLEADESAEEQALLAHRGQLTAKMKNGGNWFFWIAGLSVVNTVILLAEGDRQYMVGLGVTQFVNGFALAMAKQAPETTTAAKVAALVFTLMASAVVAAFGFGARRGLTWLFAIGMGLYLFDGLLLAAFQDWLSAGFHLFALGCMFGGLRAARELNALDRAAVAEAD